MHGGKYRFKNIIDINPQNENFTKNKNIISKILNLIKIFIKNLISILINDQSSGLMVI